MAKRIRLDRESCSVSGSAWLVTIGALNRDRKPFLDAQLSSGILNCFVESCESRGTFLHLAVLLPDHAHLIVEVTSGNLIDFLRDLKSWTTRMWWTHGRRGPLWQKSFHDRGLRSREAFDEAVKYVTENPVRLGLVESWEEYPFIAGELLVEG